MRLDKFLTEMLQDTRSVIKGIIRTGTVTVNGMIVKKNDFHIDPCKDIVTCFGKIVVYEPFLYYMLNKPAGVVCATQDNIDKTVLDILSPEDRRRDLFPVGRLDKDTEGLLLITNDGVLSHTLLSPRRHVNKVYYAKLDSAITEEEIKLFGLGIDIGDEKLTLPAVLERCNSTGSEIKVTITEGRYHQVKRMFMAFGQKVIHLKRLSMGELVLDETLKPGDYRRLEQHELEGLRQNVK